MGMFIPSGGGLGSGLSLRGGLGIPMSVNVEYFFDRQRTKNALKKATYWGLYRSGSVVMQVARRSIKKMGMAKPMLKVMKDHPNTSLRDLLKDPAIPERSKRRVAERLFEIQTKPPSMAGTPPHTHLGTFRRDIVYAYDPGSESVVIGQFMQGGAWLAALHEYGGSMQMRAWAWIPRWPRSYTRGILAYYRQGTGPKRKDRWEPTKFTETFRYPARPYMRPAIYKAAATNDVVRQFANRFSVGSG